MHSSEHTKLVFVGPVGAGKTTAVKTMAHAHCLTTDEHATDMTQERKSYTTVAMDYGVVKGEGSRRIHLYGTPGQERFSFMWDIVTQGSHGIILLLDNSRAKPVQDLQFYLKHYAEYASSGRMVLGLTKTDVNPQGLSVDDVQYELQSLGHALDVIQADVRRHEDVTRLVDAMLPRVGHCSSTDSHQCVA